MDFIEDYEKYTCGGDVVIIVPYGQVRENPLYGGIIPLFSGPADYLKIVVSDEKIEAFLYDSEENEFNFVECGDFMDNTGKQDLIAYAGENFDKLKKDE